MNTMAPLKGPKYTDSGRQLADTDSLVLQRASLKLSLELSSSSSEYEAIR
jgi:hypothetical protein